MEARIDDLEARVDNAGARCLDRKANFCFLLFCASDLDCHLPLLEAGAQAWRELGHV